MPRIQPQQPIEQSGKRRRSLCIVLIVVATLLGVTTSLVVGQFLTRTKYNEVQLTMSLIVKNIELRLDAAKTITELAARMPSVAAHDSAEAEKYLNQIISENDKMWSHFLITDEDGNEIAHTEGSVHYGKSLAERDYYQVPWNQQKTIVAQPIHSVSTGRKIIAIGVPTYHNGQVNGVLVGFIHLEYVSDLLNENHFSPNSYLFMLNGDGTVSAHLREDYVLSKQIQALTQDDLLLSKISELKSTIGLGKIEDRFGLIASVPTDRYNLSIIGFIPFYEALMDPLIVMGVLFVIVIAMIALLLFWVKMEKSVAFGKRMENTANTDKLTSLKNRHWLDAVSLESCCQEFLTVIFLDVDDFKRYNDEHDHAYGDAVLKFVGQSILGATRPISDTSIRYAGDEFVILLQDTPVSYVAAIAERLMTVLQDYQVGERAEPIYISVGIACAKRGEMSLETLVAKADNASYRAKRSGKNSMVIAE